MSCLTTYFIRHGQSTYSNIYPDLTTQGVKQAKKAGMKIKNDLDGFACNKLSLISSPAVRALGTVNLIAESIGYSRPVHKEPLLADMVIYDRPRAMTIFANVSKYYERIENVYDHDSVFEDSSVFEPRSLIRQRFYTFLWQLLENIKQYDNDVLIAISHFEVLNHFVQKLWPGAPIMDYTGILKLQLSTDSNSALVSVSAEFGDNNKFFRHSAEAADSLFVP